jgi:hypothetical protein
VPFIKFLRFAFFSQLSAARTNCTEANSQNLIQIFCRCLKFKKLLSLDSWYSWARASETTNKKKRGVKYMSLRPER